MRGGERGEERGVELEGAARAEAEDEEGHDPGAHGEELGAVAGVGDDVAHRLPRAQNRAEFQHVPALFDGRLRRAAARPALPAQGC